MSLSMETSLILDEETCLFRKSHLSSARNMSLPKEPRLLSSSKAMFHLSRHASSERDIKKIRGKHISSETRETHPWELGLRLICGMHLFNFHWLAIICTSAKVIHTVRPILICILSGSWLFYSSSEKAVRKSIFILFSFTF